MTDEAEVETPTLHLLPKYPIKLRNIVAVVKSIIAARQVVAASIAMELPESFTDPSEVRKEVREAEGRNEPIWVAAHDSYETLNAALKALRNIYADGNVLMDWDPDDEIDEQPQEAESDEHSIAHYSTALVLLQQAGGNPLQAAANAYSLANAAEDPDEMFHTMGVLIETFPYIYSGLQEAGLVGSDG